MNSVGINSSTSVHWKLEASADDFSNVRGRASKTDRVSKIDICLSTCMMDKRKKQFFYILLDIF